MLQYFRLREADCLQQNRVSAWVRLEQPNRILYERYALQRRSIFNLKINDRDEPCLEVIDGQQRLTTLSIIISVLNLELQQENISKDKLHYAIRENFFSNHIYKKEDLEVLLGKTWKELIIENTYNKQDIFYLYSAAKKVQSFFHRKL